MVKYIVRRLVGAIPVLLGLSLMVLAFLHLLPGDQAVAILGEHATPAAMERLRETLGLNKPLSEQYLTYMGDLVRGDLGNSLVNDRPILKSFMEKFPATIELSVVAMLFAIIVGLPLGRLAASRPHSLTDGAVTVVSLLGVSIPVFVLGLLLQYFLSVKVQILPPSGRIDARLDFPQVTHFMLVDTILTGNLEAFLSALGHLVLPGIALGSIPMATIARITRASVLEVANDDHVRTARAKGLSEARVSKRHIMRNAWLPVITVIGLLTGYLLAGAVITETVFAWNGVGSWVVEAINNHDYVVVQSSILVFAVIFLTVNLIVDILYAVLDPRIRYS